MPSPFPGMDPYVESAACWPSVHYRLPGLIADHLQPQIAPRHVAVAEERVYLEEPERELIPGVAIRSRTPPRGEGKTVAGVLPQRPENETLPLWVATPNLVETREYYVEWLLQAPLQPSVPGLSPSLAELLGPRPTPCAAVSARPTRRCTSVWKSPMETWSIGEGTKI